MREKKWRKRSKKKEKKREKEEKRNEVKWEEVKKVKIKSYFCLYVNFIRVFSCDVFVDIFEIKIKKLKKNCFDCIVNDVCEWCVFIIFKNGKYSTTRKINKFTSKNKKIKIKIYLFNLFY